MPAESRFVERALAVVAQKGLPQRCSVHRGASLLYQGTVDIHLPWKP